MNVAAMEAGDGSQKRVRRVNIAAELELEIEYVNFTMRKAFFVAC